uniref:Autophagy protein 5 n=1 Tax=Tetraselmis sp. GSL018 TaxID=582737 RepID=A0A061QUM4_9CHLO|mmetsp:Transcript_2850/g.6629  ORF Transcript_2850/g.6629 Transcript_2850/m.6629 type:complete len:345 (-) Transcript_2850:293-1327(-)
MLEITDEVYIQQIPLKLTLAFDQVTSEADPPSIYVMASRHTYLPCIASQELGHFQHVLQPNANTLAAWFDFEGAPLKWQFPVGVLYDLCHPGHRNLPWHLTIHYGDFPSQVLLRCDTETAVRSRFTNSLKEAAFVLTGSATSVMQMTRPQQEALWSAVAAGRVKDFWQSAGALNLSPSLRGARSSRIPVCVLVTDIPPDGRWSWEFAAATTLPVEAVSASGHETTLSEVLERCLPDKCLTAAAEQAVEPGSPPSGDGDRDALDASSSPQSSLGGPPATVLGGRAEEHPAPGRTSARVLVAGVELPLSASLLWCHELLKHPDHFLYVVVHTGRKDEGMHAGPTSS